MRANNLPSILSPSNDGVNTLSMERSLKQIKELLEDHWHYFNEDNDALEVDKIQASIDDVDIMLSCIKREDEAQLEFKDLKELQDYITANGPIPDGWKISVNNIRLTV